VFVASLSFQIEIYPKLSCCQEQIQGLPACLYCFTWFC